MEKFHRYFSNRRFLLYFITLKVLILTSDLVIDGQLSEKKAVKFERNDSQHKINIYVNGTFFTSFQFSPKLEKPFLFPVFAPNGSVITRGFPLDPRKGERTDHPHQTGLWFNFGNVNGIDFWGNSPAIPPDKKNEYGHIVLRKINKIKSGEEGILEVISNWDDYNGKIILVENTKYVFSGDESSRTIDHITTLTAANGPVIFGDSKEGMFAIRVDRAFEMPSNEPMIFTDDKGNPTLIKAIDNSEVTGMYTSSNGLKGDSVWGTRNQWVYLSGIKDNTPIAFAIFDHPENYNFPAYAHARGYGLFSMNNFGQNGFDPKLEKKEFRLADGESITLRHRFYVQSGSDLNPGKADKIFKEFSKKY